MERIYIPNRSVFTGMDKSSNKGSWADNCIWIEITPKTMGNQNISKGTSVYLRDITDDDTIKRYSFLAPRDMQETLNHSWDPLENVQAVMSQKMASVQNTINQGTNVYKIDTPLLYKDSSRRTFSFIFNLVYTGKKTPFKEVTEPIRDFMKWSSPILSNNGLDSISIPYTFSIKTKTGAGKSVDLVNIKAAALTSVQPTYSQPYIDGHPTRAELTLTFTDIEPLNRKKSFRNITVS